MKVLDATFLIDYLDGVEATRESYEAKGGEEERWVMPVPAYAEVLVGRGTSRTETWLAPGRTWLGASGTPSTSARR